MKSQLKKIRKTIILAIVLCVSGVCLGQTLTFSNSNNEINVQINYKILKNDQIVLQDSFEIPARSRLSRVIRVKRNQILDIYPKAAGKLFLATSRTYDQLNSNVQNGEHSMLNVNIIQLENLQKTFTGVAQLISELNTNAILQKLLNPTPTKDEKIRIGSFLIYNETQNEVVEVFEPTTDWDNRKNVEIFNRRTYSEIKTIEKESFASASTSVPIGLAMAASYASGKYFDFRWEVHNFREEKFGVSQEQAQTLLVKYPEKTGYKMFKELIERDTGNYKIWFVSSWSLIDSIVTYVDNYEVVRGGIDVNFDYPQKGTRVFGVDINVAYEKQNSEKSIDVTETIYNYFEISDITTSAKLKIRQEAENNQEQQQKKEREEYIKNLTDKKETIENKIRSTYLALCEIDNRYKKQNDISIICVLPFFKKSAIVISDTLNQEIKNAMELSNMEISTANSFVDYIRKLKDELENLNTYLDEINAMSSSQIREKIAAKPTSVPTRILSDREMDALFKYPNK